MPDTTHETGKLTGLHLGLYLDDATLAACQAEVRRVAMRLRLGAPPNALERVAVLFLHANGFITPHEES